VPNVSFFLGVYVDDGRKPMRDLLRNSSGRMMLRLAIR